MNTFWNEGSVPTEVDDEVQQRCGGKQAAAVAAPPADRLDPIGPMLGAHPAILARG
jgi:hypothetical protein